MKWKSVCCVTNPNLMRPRCKRGRLVASCLQIRFEDNQKNMVV